MDDSVAEVTRVLRAIGKVDGIIGFSQGGALLDFILQRCADGRLPYLHIPTRTRMVFISTFHHRDGPVGTETPMQPLPWPSLHVYGRNDTLIPVSASEELARRYDDAELFAHDGRHVAPGNADARWKVAEFFMK